MNLTASLLATLLFLSGCSYATSLREVRLNQPIATRHIESPYRSLARCTFDALEDKAESTRALVYQLRETEQDSRIAEFSGALDYYVLTLIPSITTNFELLFLPTTPTTTTLEVRAGWAGTPDGVSQSVLPLIEHCSRQQAALQTAPPATIASPK